MLKQSGKWIIASVFGRLLAGKTVGKHYRAFSLPVPTLSGWLLIFSTLFVLGCFEEELALLSPPTSESRYHLVVPEEKAYTGAYIDFGEYEDDVTREQIDSFDTVLNGRKQSIIAFSSVWGRQSFPKRQAEIVIRYGALPLIYWSPWLEPFPKDRRPGEFSLTEINSGLHDTYIDSWGDQVAQLKKPVFVAFGIEMNGEWFPWSGLFYGRDGLVPGSSPQRFQGPDTWIKAYRRVVDRVRARGADNVLWVFHANNTSAPDEPWNQVNNYWPGADYVDWIALSVYGKQFRGEGWIGFNEAFEPHFQRMLALDPSKPFMLAEWGVGEFPESGDKAKWIKDGFMRMSRSSSRLKAAIYWHERWQNEDLTYSNLRINSSPESLKAYREGVSHDFWLDRPILLRSQEIKID